MCGRLVTNIPAEALKEIFALIETPKLEPRYNVLRPKWLPLFETWETATVSIC